MFVNVFVRGSYSWLGGELFRGAQDGFFWHQQLTLLKELKPLHNNHHVIG